MDKHSTTRFSNRVADYVKYRPHYPAEVVEFLRTGFGLDADKLIADIGAGTGISTKLFLDAGYIVIAVEPNKEMLDMAIELLGSIPGFVAQNGTAESTGLGSGTVDAIISGQAFHWFDRDKAKVEFKRVLKPGGLVVLLWNERKTVSPFESALDGLIVQHGNEYIQLDHRNIDMEKIAAFFSPAAVRLQVFANQQVFDFEGLKGRLLSSSYMPTKNDAGYHAMVSDLQQLFDKYQSNGTITIHYDTKVYVGRL